MKRPLAIWALALIWGITLSDVNNYHLWGIISLILSIFIFILISRPLREKSSGFIFIAIPLLISGYVLHSINKNYYENSCKEWEGSKVSVEGALFNEPEFKDGKTRFIMNVESIDNQVISKNKKIRIQVSIYGDSQIHELKYGSVVNIISEIRIPLGRRNFGGFNSKKFLASRGVSGTIGTSEKALTILKGNRALWFKNTGYKLRHNMIDTLNKCMPDEYIAFHDGFLSIYCLL